MTWTITNLLTQMVAGIVGGYIAAAATREHNFGALAHAAMGAIGGGLSGAFLQTFVGTIAATGDPVEPALFELCLVQALGGITAGAIASLSAGFIKLGIDEERSAKAS